MINKIRTSIAKLIKQEDKIIVGFSGGADSVCLLHALCSLADEFSFTVIAAHVNHMLRGKEAERDEAFARDFCVRLGIPCFVKRIDVRALAQSENISEEAAGRRARYAFFEELASQEQATKIATAHHKNDNAETILMHLFRGTALTGLAGIAAQRGNIIRPLLDLSRADIECYCAENNLSFVTDSTNTQNAYTRNRIRNECIPYIETYFNPNFIQTVTKNACIIADENAYLDGETTKLYCALVADGAVSIDALVRLPLALRRRLIRKMCETAGIHDVTADYIENILRLCSGSTGKEIALNNHRSARISYGKLIIAQSQPQSQPYEYHLTIGQSARIVEAGMFVCVEKDANPSKNSFYFPHGASLYVRSRKAGDFFYPVGMTGKKKLQDYFIDAKISRDMRGSVPLLVCNGEIAWVVGMRRDRRFVSGEQACRVSIQYEK